MPVLPYKGCNLAYLLEGSGPPVLMIQGVGVLGSGWLPQLPALTPHFTCLTYDNRGLGKSQPVGAKITIPQLAEDALALMDAQGWDSAHVVGHSMGGVIAQEVALRARNRVKSLTLLCTVSKGTDATSLTPFRFFTGIRTWVGTAAGRRKAFLQMVLPPHEVPADPVARAALAEKLAVWFGHNLANHPPNAIRQLNALSAHDTTPRLKELAGIPTLVVSAELDHIAPAKYGRALAEGIPGAKYVEIRGASHGAPMVRANEVNAHLLAHLNTC